MRTSQPATVEPIPLGPTASERACEIIAEFQNRPEEVPDDIERQNLASLQRNEDADRATGTAGDAGVPESVREVISSSGQSLDASIQRAVEERMGDSFGDVQIHTGPQAAKACEDINARAFTVGNHIAFNHGEYDPESPEGQHLLAHELAHVRQQTGAAISMMPQANVELEIDPDPQLEREAEETAQRVMEGGELGIQRMGKTEVHVQRSVKGALSSIGSKLGLGGSTQEETSRFRELDDGDLDETIAALVENQREIITTLENQERGTTDVVGETAGKGVVGGGIGFAVTTLTANPALGAIAAGMFSDVGKLLYGNLWDSGRDAIANAEIPDVGLEQLGGIKQSIEKLVDEKIRQRFGGDEHVNNSEDLT
ncbi:DUF4157 domain-containing protein [Halovivax cerinus]|uniref:DUF4157 domain-containing protein n=1 Tax=Halovivax cerinus TaxID=1487865 RepID=A0ABD5NRG0_9EURY|nr:DUF4157 domain-containing protein [Halovivax cerinus]